MTRSGVRWANLLAFLVGAGALAWVVLRVVLRSGGSIPQVSWVGVGVLAVLAAVLAVAGWDIKRYLDGRHRRRPSPSRARYTLTGAQAGGLAGATLTGWYGASALVAASLPDVPATREHVLRYGVHAGVAVVLALAGMFAQWCCQLPPEDDDEERARPRPGGSEPVAG